ncbi:hypothetical protein HJD18_07975 [Thermoleophilia bacterium SCSIO 60948]|nr:hypothetical protein HJD18_07975 [Thermoleophilia bacterium SCSIO 60948]
MLKRGPVPAVVHGLVEYVAGLLLIVAPILVEYGSSGAVAVSVILGVLILIIAASSDMPTGLISQIPVGAHVVLDFVLAVILIASPFVFGFSSEATPTWIFIVLGILHLLLTIATRFERDPGIGPPPRRDGLT